MPTAFNKGIDDSATLAGVGFADKQPVFLPDGRGADGVFDQIVVDLHPAIGQIDFQRAPLAQGIIQRCSQEALRQMVFAGFEFYQDAFVTLTI